MHPSVSPGNIQPSFLNKGAEDGRVERIMTAMRNYLRPGDTVHPIDWTEGVIQAMLTLERPMATPFFYDIVFHHSVDAETIKPPKHIIGFIFKGEPLGSGRSA